MIARVEPGPARFRGAVPGDKSITHRAILLATLADGESDIRRPLVAADTAATLRLAAALGARVAADGDRIRIVGRRPGPLPGGVVDCANSGTTARLGIGLAAGLAAQGGRLGFDGDASLRRRPMRRVTEPLAAAGVGVRDDDGRLPVTVEGGSFAGGSFRLTVASAQVKSALLLAGVAAGRPVRVEEPLLSRDHTERMLRLAGVPVREAASDGGPHAVEVEPAPVAAQSWDVPGDPSSAAFLWALGALPGNEVEVTGVSLNPTRGRVLDVLRAMGAEVDVRPTGRMSGEEVGDVRVRGREGLRPFAIGAADVPALIDEIPVLAVLALVADGESKVRGAAELRVKESDRLAAVAAELRKAGAVVEELPDGLVVRGGRRLRAAAFDAHGDHRLAMALAVLATTLPDPSTIAGAETVAVSFPGFWEVLAGALGRPPTLRDL